MLSRVRLPRSATAVACVAIVGSLTAGAFAARSSSTPAASQPRPTATTARDTPAGVTSSGSLTAVSEQNLGFAKGGQLTSVRVQVGDHVKAGDVLATIDDEPAREALASAEAQLRGAQAGLDKSKDSPTVNAAEDSLDQAKDILRAVRRQADALDAADATAVANAQRQSDLDQAAAAAAPGDMNAQQKASSSSAALANAQQKRNLDQATSRVSVETAQQSVVAAQNAVDTSDSDRPHTIDQGRAAVDGARAAVALAQHDLANTTLRAPADGTVTALNGAVGEYVAPSTGTSALAPGTDASIPGASGSTSSGSSGSSGPSSGSAAPSRPGGSQFIVLSDIDQLQVIALFNEADAAAIHPGQDVDVTFDAVPDLTARGTVASVAPGATSVSGVISYYVTVNLTDGDARLKSGQTANVTVLTDGDSSEEGDAP